MALLFAASFLSLAAGAPPPLQFYTAVNDSFTLANSTLYHNRPLYGPHNSALVLTGDLPVTHLANDHDIFGGFLFGLQTASNGTGLWAHQFSSLISTYTGGAMEWSLSDSRLPGVSLQARTLPTATGTGFVLDLNVTCSGAGEPVHLVWAHGCAVRSDAVVGSALDPLVHPETLTWVFSPEDCSSNTVALSHTGSNFTVTFSGGQVAVNLDSALSAALAIVDASDYSNVTALFSSTNSSALSTTALPIANASLWLRAATLAASTPNGTAIAAWADESGSQVTLTQPLPARQPMLHTSAFGAGVPALLFDGTGAYLSAPNGSVGTESTMFAVFRDDGSTGGDDCCSGVLFYGSPVANQGCNGIATLPAPPSAVDDDDHASSPALGPIVTKLDYPGSDANGHLDIRGRLVVAASLYSAGSQPLSTWHVDGCLQGSRAMGGTPGTGVMVGARGAELGRYFRGALAEVVVFPRALAPAEMQAMTAYFYAAYPAMAPKHRCSAGGGMGAGRTAAPIPAGPTPTRFTWAVAAAAAGAGPGAPTLPPLPTLAAADARLAVLTRSAASTPNPLVGAALRSLGVAVDGLFRDSPPAFVHGAMAWDSLYLGWRSQYGGTVLGRPELVEAEGAYFMGQQDSTSPRDVPCASDPAYQYTKEGPTSRFNGRGKINANSGMYNMQTQFFDQQLHAWRWGGSSSIAARLLPALLLHAEWAADCFDGDGDGLYASYINTWPTDSQWYGGGATAEETGYEYRVQLAIRDLAARVGDAATSAAAAATAAKIRAAFQQLWLPSEGHPAASREEGGHQRLRPDAWLYSVFVPIEAGLLPPEQAAQALYYTEWALQRDPVPCSSSSSSQPCGVVVWTSNWVPSQWSVRQLWPGDVSGLALAYLLAGLPDDGWQVLAGAMHSDMLQRGVPGQAGKSNGGLDFNDCVHPLARALVEGLFGVRPDRGAGLEPGGVFTVAPQLPSAWQTPSGGASLNTSDIALRVTYGGAGGVGDGSVTVEVCLAAGAAQLVVRMPARVAVLGQVAVGPPPSSCSGGGGGTGAWQVATRPGFGQTEVEVSIAAGGGGLVTGATVTFGASSPPSPLPYTPSVALNATCGQLVTLRLPPGLLLAASPPYTDPQGLLVPGSAAIGADNASLTGLVAQGAAGHRMVIAYAVAAGSASGAEQQMVLFKLQVAPGAAAVAAAAAAAAVAGSARAATAAAWAFAPVPANGDLTAIFAEGTYLSPRPQTCAVRIGTNGYAAWTFPYFHISPPPVTFSALGALSIGGGVIATPQGAHFLLPNSTAASPRNIAFASLWDNFPPSVAVPAAAAAAALPNASSVWVLVAGSTNPMQTGLPNAVLRFAYASGAVEELQLLPPQNFWALNGWGTADYSYDTDAWCLPATPPPTVQLGEGNRAMVYSHGLNSSAGALSSVTLEVLSQEVVIGILAVSLMG